MIPFTLPHCALRIRGERYKRWQESLAYHADGNVLSYGPRFYWPTSRAPHLAYTTRGFLPFEYCPLGKRRCWWLVPVKVISVLKRRICMAPMKRNLCHPKEPVSLCLFSSSPCWGEQEVGVLSACMHILHLLFHFVTLHFDIGVDRRFWLLLSIKKNHFKATPSNH